MQILVKRGGTEDKQHAHSKHHDYMFCKRSHMRTLVYLKHIPN